MKNAREFRIKKMYNEYDTKCQIYSAIRKHKPLLFVRTKNGEYKVVVCFSNNVTKCVFRLTSGITHISQKWKWITIKSFWVMIRMMMT